MLGSAANLYQLLNETAELTLQYMLQLQDSGLEYGIPEVQAKTIVKAVDWVRGSADGRARRVNVGDSPVARAQPR